MHRPPIFLLILFLLLWNGAAQACAGEAGLDGMTRLVRLRFPRVAQLSTAELMAWLVDPSRKKPMLLDVRTAEEYAIGHLPGAIRVEPSSKAAAILPLLSAGAPVVAYCSVGYRSSAVVQRLMKASVPSVLNLEGSIFQWANEGGSLESNGRPANKVHPYNATFGNLLNADKRGF